jgi:hypothetical protein
MSDKDRKNNDFSGQNQEKTEKWEQRGPCRVKFADRKG